MLAAYLLPVAVLPDKAGAASATLSAARDEAASPTLGITVLNLPEESDKWDSVRRELEAVGAPYVRFSSPCHAHTALSDFERALFKVYDPLWKSTYPQQYPWLLAEWQREHGGPISFDANGVCSSGANCGSMACACSHFRIWQQNQDKDVLVVAEDDIMLMPKAWNRTLDVIRNVSARDPGWSSIVFGASKFDHDFIVNDSDPRENTPPDHHGLWKYTDGLWKGTFYPHDRTRTGASFYAVSRKGMERTLRKVRRDGGLWRGADYALLHDRCEGDCWVETGGVLRGIRVHKSQTTGQVG